MFGFQQPSKTGSEQDDLRPAFDRITVDFTSFFFFRGCFIDLSGFSCGFTWIETQQDVDCFHVAGIQPIFLDAPSRMPDHLKS